MELGGRIEEILYSFFNSKVQHAAKKKIMKGEELENFKKIKVS